LNISTQAVTELSTAFKELSTIDLDVEPLTKANAELSLIHSGLKETLFGVMPAQAKERWSDFFETFRQGLEEIQGSLPSIKVSIGENLLNSISGIGDIFANAVSRWDGTAKGFFKSIAQGFANMAQQIIAEMIRIAIMRLVLNLVGLFGGGGGSARDIGGIAGVGGHVGGAAGPGFASGGFTGAGSSGAIAGLVHKNEFVMPSAAVQKFGVGFMESIKNLQTPPRASAAAGSTGGGSRSITFNINASGGTQSQNQQSAAMIRNEIMIALRKDEMRNK
jgi:hypothetical protein